jgi:hypothetical protein
LSEVRPPLVGAAERFAHTEVSLTRVRLHGSVPEQAPVHPVKVELALGFAFNRTDVPVAKLALHISPQLMPAGALVTVPVPVPKVVTVS